PMFKALKACPEAVVLPPNIAKYSAVGREVRQLMLELTPLVEPLSIDEAFLDLSGTERVHHGPPAETLARFAARVEANIGITVSVGLSHNKFLAKIASDLDKPRGFSAIGRAEAFDFLGSKPVGFIWGVGRAMQARLARDGIRTIAQLQRMEESDLGRRYGALGLRLAQLSRGIDNRRISPDSPAKSVSAETTFDTDVGDPVALRRTLRKLCEKVSTRLKAAGLAGSTVTLKLKTADFKLRTRSRRLADPTQLADRIFRTAADLLEREAYGRTLFRLIGAGVADFGDLKLADPDDLVDDGAHRRAAAEHAMDAIRKKFGNDTLRLGITIDPAREKPGRRGPGK
ncbi:MAG: DNA polymerase IV, partial [Hyphomicrobiales bacterium]|nr:DNA polymerase IV [Hyphomicrobiales bacterium]